MSSRISTKREMEVVDDVDDEEEEEDMVRVGGLCALAFLFRFCEVPPLGRMGFVVVDQLATTERELILIDGMRQVGVVCICR